MISTLRKWGMTKILAALLAFMTAHAFAEVTTDGTLGAAQSLSGLDFAITADLGQQRGGNLFHSFSFFNINTGESATFSGPSTVNNIISRVTGGSASLVDGALNSTIPGANLFLINPSGVMFGENATLNISGSFHASTAGYLVLADGGRFDAVTPGNSVLTSAPPSAFGFLDNPAAISVQNSKLLVESGKTLSIVGGDVSMDSAILYAPGGKVQVASVQSAGEVGVDVSTLAVDNYGQLGDIDVSHEGDFFSRFVPGVGIAGNIDVTAEDGGTVVIRGGQFVADSALMFADGNTGDAGKVDIQVSGSLRAANGTTVTADQFGSGLAGEMTVAADKIILESGGRLQVDNYGPGAGGTLTVTAADSIEIEGRSSADLPFVGDQQSGMYAASFGAGEGGDISVNTTGLSVGAQGKIELNSISGAGGDLSLTADTVNLHDAGAIQLDALGSGNAGMAMINTRVLEINSGGSIATKSLGEGSAGNLNIAATESVTLTGQGDLDPSGLYSNAFSSGDGGQIKVVTPDLTVTNGARIQAGAGENPDVTGLPPATAMTQAGSIELQVERLNVFAAAQVSTQSENAAQAGDINVQASDTVNISSPAGALQSGLFSTASGTGAGGNITVTGGTLSMFGGAINVSSINTGDAGSIGVLADSVSMNNGAQISTSVDGAGNGGLLRVTSGGAVKLDGQAGDGFQTGLYSLTEGAGTGGNIEVSGSKVKLTNNATMNSESHGSGNAGNIDVTAVSTVKLKNASINTSADNADGGNIKITATDMVELTNSEITAAVGGGEGDGGNVTIDPEFVILSSSRILASAIGGDGGNITIITDHFIASPDSVLDASSELGIDGTINILSPDEEITSNLVELPAAYLDASGLLRERCSTRHQAATQSSFTVAGRNSLPTTPDSQYSLLSSVSDSFSGAGAVTRSSPAQQFIAASLAAGVFGCSL